MLEGGEDPEGAELLREKLKAAEGIEEDKSEERSNEG
jgi:hypothetical protein